MTRLLRLPRLIAILGLLSLPASAQTYGSFVQWCQSGGATVNTSGIASSSTVQASYPKCQVSVYLTGTLTLATIYSTATLTPLANPFCANLDASFIFYALTSVLYDVVIANANACNPPPFLQLPAPFTFNDQSVSGSGGSGGSGTVSPATTNQIGVYLSSSNIISGKSWADLDSLQYGVGGGTAQAQSVSLAPGATSLVAGLEVNYLPIAANTGAGPTLAVNGLAARTITKFGATALAASDITTTAIASVIYDGTHWQLQNPQTATGGGGGGSGCIPNPSDGGCAFLGNPSIDSFIGGSIGGGTGFLTQLLSNAYNVLVPLNVTTANAGVVSLGCSADPGLGSGIALVAPATCTPWNLYFSQTPGTGFMVGTAVGSKVTQAFQTAIDLTQNVVNNLPVANGGTGNSTPSGALVNLFPTPTRNGDIEGYWNGSAWNNFPGNNSGTGFFSENGAGSPGWIASPIPPANGGTGLSTMVLNTVYKGNTTSAMQPTGIVDNGSVVTVSEPVSAAPIYVNSGTATSQGNECASIVTDTSGGTVTAAAALRTIDSSSVGHDIMCVVTADATNPTAIGSVVFPYTSSFSAVSASSQLVKGSAEIIGSPALLTMTNNSGTSKANSINLRGCTSLNTSCGTEVTLKTDPNGTNLPEFGIDMLGDGWPFFVSNALNTSLGICLGGADARTSGVWCIDRVLGSSSHIVRHQSDTDAWGTVTLASGTFAFTFNRVFASAPICLATWQGVGTLTGIVKCVTSTTGFTITSSVGTDTAVMAYQILGNNN